MTFEDKFKVVDKWMFWCRYKEEIIQTKLEMHKYLKSLSSVRFALERKIKKLRIDSEEINIPPEERTLLKGKALLAGMELTRIIRKEHDALVVFSIDPCDSRDAECMRFDVSESPDLVGDDDDSANSCSEQVDLNSDEDGGGTSSEEADTDCEYSLAYGSDDD